MDTAYVGEHPPQKIAGNKVQYLRFRYLKFLVTELTFWRRCVGWKTLRTSSFCVSQQLQVARIAEVGAESERWEGGGDSWFHWFWVSCDPWHIPIDLNDISVYWYYIIILCIYIYLLYYFGCGYLHLIVCMPIDGKQGPCAASQLSFFTQWSSQAEMATLILQPIYVANFEWR